MLSNNIGNFFNLPKPSKVSVLTLKYPLSIFDDFHFEDAFSPRVAAYFPSQNKWDFYLIRFVIWCFVNFLKHSISESLMFHKYFFTECSLNKTLNMLPNGWLCDKPRNYQKPSKFQKWKEEPKHDFGKKSILKSISHFKNFNYRHGL